MYPRHVFQDLESFFYFFASVLIWCVFFLGRSLAMSCPLHSQHRLQRWMRRTSKSTRSSRKHCKRSRPTASDLQPLWFPAMFPFLRTSSFPTDLLIGLSWFQPAWSRAGLLDNVSPWLINPWFINRGVSHPRWSLAKMLPATPNINKPWVH